ncbi:BREX-1 system phosphatase PglZ type A [Geobacillus thermoleovorans]|uniref:BREX-1 system phosphatase PglZ type A n=1 Tax=Geobacillus thermoleovorans TaxID=33941 RepID=UPI00345C0199
MDIIQELLQLFDKQMAENKGANRAIVFWYDPQSEERDFEEIERALNEKGINVWELNDHNAFQTKVRLEIEDLEHSYLIYAPFPKPKDDENFLLDILLYSGKYGEFQADEVAILMKELRLDHLAIRTFIEAHWAFFRNRRRVEKFQKLLPNHPNADDIKQAMMAVLCEAKSIHPQELLKSVVAHKGGMSDENEALSQIGKYMDVNLFFELIEEYFGVSPTEQHRLAHIMETIVYQHATSQLDEKVWPVHYHSNVPNICKVFIDDWLKSDDRGVLEAILRELEQCWNVPQLIDRHTYQPFIRCFTFPVIERKVLDVLHELLLSEAVHVSEWKSLLAERRKGYWYQTHFAQEYELLEKMVDFYEWKMLFERDDVPKDEEQWFSLYTEKYYRIDQLYRQIHRLYRKETNLERYEPLMEKVTFWYENRYLAALAGYTDRFLELKWSKQWPMSNVMQQTRFYQHFIQPLLEATRERIFVIISDGLRYEIGVELFEEFRQRLNTEVNIIPMQAVLPTYTQLGMAALLPGNVTEIKEDGTVYVNGMSTKGLSNRNKILQMYEPDSIALKLEEFIRLPKEEGQAYIRGKRVVYLYHDAIDCLVQNKNTEFCNETCRA